MTSIAFRDQQKLKMRYIDENEDQMVVKSLSVPPGLETLMEGLTREVLKVQPQDICLFASEHFARLIKMRERAGVEYKFCKTTINDKNKQKNLQSKSAQNPKNEIEMLNGDASLSVPQLDLAKITNDASVSPEIKLNRSEASTAEIDKIQSGFFESKELFVDETNEIKKQRNVEDETIEGNNLTENESGLKENEIVQENEVLITENLQTENENEFEIVKNNLLQKTEEENETIEQNDVIQIYSDINEENVDTINKGNEEGTTYEIIENETVERIKEIENNIDIIEQSKINEEEEINQFDDNKELQIEFDKNVEYAIHTEIEKLEEIENLNEKTNDEDEIIKENELNELIEIKENTTEEENGQIVQEEVSTLDNDKLSDNNDIIIDETDVKQSTIEILDENADKMIHEKVEDLIENNGISLSIEEVENISAFEDLKISSEDEGKLKDHTEEESNTKLVDKQNNAATKIQSIWRGYNIRKNKTNDGNIKSETLFNPNYKTLHNVAATKIQSLWRGFNQRKHKNPIKFENTLLNSVAKGDILELASATEKNPELELTKIEKLLENELETEKIIDDKDEKQNESENIEQTAEKLNNSETELIENQIEIIDLNISENSINKQEEIENTENAMNENKVILDSNNEINEDHEQPLKENETFRQKSVIEEEISVIKINENKDESGTEIIKETIDQSSSFSEQETSQIENSVLLDEPEQNNKETNEDSVNLEENDFKDYATEVAEKNKVTFTVGPHDIIEISETTNNLTEEIEMAENIIDDITENAEKQVEEILDRSENIDEITDRIFENDENEINRIEKIEIEKQILIDEQPLINKIGLQHSGEMHDSLILPEINENQDAIEDNDTTYESNSLQHSGEMHDSISLTNKISADLDFNDDNKLQDSSNIFDDTLEKAEALTNSANIVEEINDEDNKQEDEINVISQEIQNKNDMEDTNTTVINVFESVDDNTNKIQETIEIKTDLPPDMSQEMKDTEKLEDLTNISEQMDDFVAKLEGGLNNDTNTPIDISQDIHDTESIKNTSENILEKELQESVSDEIKNIINDGEEETTDILEKLNDEISEVTDIPKTVESNVNIEIEKLDNFVANNTVELSHVTQEMNEIIRSDINELLNDNITNNLQENENELSENVSNVMEKNNVSNENVDISETIEDVNNIVEINSAARVDNNDEEIVQHELVIEDKPEQEEIQNNLNETTDSIENNIENIVDNANETVVNLKQDIKEAVLELEDKLDDLEGNESQTTDNIQETIVNEEHDIINNTNNLEVTNEVEASNVEKSTNEKTISLQEDESSNIEETPIEVNEFQDAVENNKDIKEIEIEHEVKSDIESISTEDQAATKIQSTWRGYNSRQKQKYKLEDLQNEKCDDLSQQKDETESISSDILSKAATTLQAGVRGYLVRKRSNISTNLSNNDSSITTVNKSEVISSLSEKTTDQNETVTNENNENSTKISIDEMEKELDEIKALNERLKKLTKHDAYEEDISISENENNDDSLELDKALEKLKEHDNENPENLEITEILHPKSSTNLDDFDSSKYDLKVNTFSPRSKTSSPIEELSSAAYKIGAVIAVNDNSVLNAINPQEKIEEKEVEYIHIPLHGPILEETKNVVEESTDNKTHSSNDSESPEYIYIPLKAPDSTDNQEGKSPVKITSLQHSGEMHDSIEFIGDISEQISLNEISKNASSMDTLLNATKIQPEEMHDSLIFTETEEGKQLNIDDNTTDSIDKLANEPNTEVMHELIEDKSKLFDTFSEEQSIVQVPADKEDVIEQNIDIDFETSSINSNVEKTKDTLNDIHEIQLNIQENISSDVEKKTEIKDTKQSFVITDYILENDHKNTEEENQNDAVEIPEASNKDISEKIDSKALEDESEISDSNIEGISNSNETHIVDNKEMNLSNHISNEQESEENITKITSNNENHRKLEETEDTITKNHIDLNLKENNDDSEKISINSITENVIENTDLNNDMEVKETEAIITEENKIDLQDDNLKVDEQAEASGDEINLIVDNKSESQKNIGEIDKNIHLNEVLSIDNKNLNSEESNNTDSHSVLEESNAHLEEKNLENQEDSNESKDEVSNELNSSLEQNENDQEDNEYKKPIKDKINEESSEKPNEIDNKDSSDEDKDKNVNFDERENNEKEMNNETVDESKEDTLKNNMDSEKTILNEINSPKIETEEILLSENKNIETNEQKEKSPTPEEKQIETIESDENKLNETIESPRPASSAKSPIDDVDAFLERNKSRSSSRQSNPDTTNKKLFNEIDTIIESYGQKRQMSPTNLAQSAAEALEIDNDSLNQGQHLSVQENLPDVEMLRAENAAAAKIQTAFKGFKSRQKMRIKQEIAKERKNSLESNKTYTIGNPSPNNITSPEEISSDEELAKNAAALKIQNTYRSYRQKRSLPSNDVQDLASNNDQIENMNLAALEDKFLDYPVLNDNTPQEELKDISEITVQRNYKPKQSHENSELAPIPESGSPNIENKHFTIDKSNGEIGQVVDNNATDEDGVTSGMQSESPIYDGDESDGKSSPDENRAQGHGANSFRGVETLGTSHDTIDIKISSEELSQGAEMLTSQDAKLTASGGGDDGAHAASLHSDMETANNKQMPAEQQQQNMEKRQSGDEALAATKIQAGFRGYQVRKQMKIKKNGSEEAKTAKRGGSGRRRNSGRRATNDAPKSSTDLEERSATKIQAGIRGFLVRKRQRNSKDVIA